MVVDGRVITLYEPGSHTPLAMLDNTLGLLDIDTDHLGTPKALYDRKTGDELWSTDHTLYGQTTNNQSHKNHPKTGQPLDPKLRFQGQYEDLETGLYQNLNRYYDPHSGRYINHDPIGLMGGLNQYQYCPNPVEWIDPLGLKCEDGKSSETTNGVPLTQAQIEEIQATPKGKRPDPSEYLPKSYIDAHLQKFEGGASRFMTQTNLQKYGPGQRDGTSFVMPSSEADKLISLAKGDKLALADSLGLPREMLESNALVRVDFNNPIELGLRMPSGNEAGANEYWIPGGKLPDGASEAVIDVGDIPSSQYTTKTID